MNRQRYDDFYVAYLDSAGNVVYPSDLEEAKIIRHLLKNPSSNNYVYTDDGRCCYKMRVKRKCVDGQNIQIVELSNVTEYMELISKASMDEVTHLHNRRMVTYDYLEYIEQAAKSGEDFAIMLADVDNFKNVNETYGHPAGDMVLSEISRMIYCSTRHNQREDYEKRNQDIVGRYGGDEFFALLKNIDKKNARKKVELIANNVRNHRIPLFSEEEAVTYIPAGSLSIGLYHVTNEELLELFEKGNTPDDIGDLLYYRCDAALRKSKRTGKNRITVYGEKKIEESEELEQTLEETKMIADL